MLNKKAQLPKLTFTVSPRFAEEGGEDFTFSGERILIGSGEKCDYIIDHPEVSELHALLIDMGEGIGKIIDLSSLNGSFINGRRVQESNFAFGDTISLGTLQLSLSEGYQSPEFFVFDQKVKRVENQTEAVVFHDIPDGEGYALIDDTPVYLDFGDEGYASSGVIPLFDSAFTVEEPLMEEKDFDPIAKKAKGEAIRMLTLSKGNIISVDYIPHQFELISMGGKQKRGHLHSELFGEKYRAPFLVPKETGYEAKTLEGFEFEGSNILSSGSPLVLRRGATEIFLSIEDAPPSLFSGPIWQNDKDFNKELGKTFGLGALILLLLTLVPMPEPPEEKKEIAVIYKAKKKSVAKVDAASVKQDNPENLKPMKKVKTQEASAKPKKTKVAKKQPKAAPKKTVAKKQAKSPSRKVAKKADTYKNPFAAQMNTLLGSSGSPSKVRVKGGSQGATNNLAVNSSAVGSAQAANFDNTGTSLGSGKGVAQDTTMGASGLVDKKGIVSTMMATKTVVLGAIDPDLLRRILQEYLPQFRHCYQQELEFSSEDASGVVDLNFTIDKNGKAKRINIVSKAGKFSKQGTNCMAKVLSIIPFPKPKGGGIVDVRQPLNFSKST